MDQFSADELSQFERDGFLVVRRLAAPDLVDRIVRVTEVEIARATPPVELEAEVGYPGAPASIEGPGGGAVRRILQVITRDPVYLEWAASRRVVSRLAQLLGPELVLPLGHHNCVMAKDPKFSSDTTWHQDFRYWRFRRPELISVLLALDESDADRGALQFLAGTHRREFRTDQYDERLFLRSDLPENEELVSRAIRLEAEPGDAIFFHCKTFHAARRNRSDRPARSLIFTYRSADNLPIPGTRSARSPELLLPVG
jgi:phytanoyl-CoA hydroxylase